MRKKKKTFTIIELNPMMVAKRRENILPHLEARESSFSAKTI